MHLCGHGEEIIDSGRVERYPSTRMSPLSQCRPTTVTLSPSEASSRFAIQLRNVDQKALPRGCRPSRLDSDERVGPRLIVITR